MQLLANVCRTKVVLPSEPSASVLLGAAILGRYSSLQARGEEERVDRLWEIMVSDTMSDDLDSTRR
jgi:hypothetical protein